MDGFDSSTKVIVIGATNRPEVLDRALLRPGRFNRRVTVQPADRNGRQQILEVHTRDVPLAVDVDLAAIAASTPGMVGADLANLVNEATLLAARRNHAQVTHAEFTDALEKIVLGSERKVLMTRGRPSPDRLPRRRACPRRHAHRRRGPSAEDLHHPPWPVARGHPGRPERRSLYLLRPRATCEDRRRAGREDRRGDRLRRRHHGSRIGHPAAHPDRPPDDRPVGNEHHCRADRRAPTGGTAQPDETSEETQRLVDQEVRTLVATAHDDVTRLLTEHRDHLDSLAEALLEHETLDQADAYAAAGMQARHVVETGAAAVAARTIGVNQTAGLGSRANVDQDMTAGAARST